MEVSKFEQIKSLAKRFFRQGAQTAIDSLLLLKRLTPKERFYLSKLEPFFNQNEFAKICALYKQGKVDIILKKIGWSFLISGKDLIPQLIWKHPFAFDRSSEFSDEQFIKQANLKIKKKFFEERFTEFAERAWGILPQYIAPNSILPIHIKQAVVLQLFCNAIRMLLIGKGKDILKSARELDNSLFTIYQFDQKTKLRRKVLALSKRARKGPFNLILKIGKPRQSKIENLIDKIIVKEKELNPEDIKFIRKYIKARRALKVELPPKVLKKIKSFAKNLGKKKALAPDRLAEGLVRFVQASAAMEGRTIAESKDLLRVFNIFKRSL